MFGSTFGAAKIDSEGIKFILACLVLSSRVDFISEIYSNLKLGSLVL